MSEAQEFLIGANDEHGLNPPTAGKRTPILPYVNRSFYENEFNFPAKRYFLEACLRVGFSTYDLKPETTDIPVSTRAARANQNGVSLCVTFAYNAFGSGNTFNSAKGYTVYYSERNRFARRSRELSEDVFEALLNNGFTPARSVSTLDVTLLSSVRAPSTLIEAGFMTNFEEAKLMINPEYRLAVAERACRGVCADLGVRYIERGDLSAYPTLMQGYRGNKVKLLQYLLNEYGANLEPDGIFGRATKTALNKFKSNNGLPQDGVADRNTYITLLDETPQAQLAMFGSRRANVWFLQNKLLSMLYPISSVDGIFGRETQNAVIAFQSENGLIPDGIVGVRTWPKIIEGRGRPQL